MPTGGDGERTCVDLPDGTRLWTRRLSDNGRGTDGVRSTDQDSGSYRSGPGREDRQDNFISQVVLDRAAEYLYEEISYQAPVSRSDLRDALAYALSTAGMKFEATTEPDFFDSQEDAARMEEEAQYQKGRADLLRLRDTVELDTAAEDQEWYERMKDAFNITDTVELDDESVEDKDWWPEALVSAQESMFLDEEDADPQLEVEDSIVFEEIVDEEDDDEPLTPGQIIGRSLVNKFRAAQQEASFNSVKTKGIYIKHISDVLKPEASLYHGRNKDSMKIRDDADCTLWRSGKGLDTRIIHIKNMDNNHLYNSIRYLAAKNERSAMLENELEFRLSQWRKANGLEESKPAEEKTTTVTRKIIRS